MKKRIIILILFSAFVHNAIAQDENDALRFGMSQYFGTARGMAIGNATGSIGGDFSTLSVNPAGIGIYRKSEFSFTPNFSASKNESTYLNENTSDQKSKLNFAQVGLIITNAKKGNAAKRSAWKTGSFGFGLNRIANFSNNYSYTGKNNLNSIVNKWADDINALGGYAGLATANYSAYAAYQTYLIDTNFAGDRTKVKSNVPISGLQQTKQVFETGGMNELVFSAGGNYLDKLMLGATLGITSINYNRTFNFEEKDISGNLSNDFSSLQYTEKLATSGTGVNLKLGAILKASDNFRFGLALHTPTAIYLNDVSSIIMTSNTESLKIRTISLSASPITTYKQDSIQAYNYTLFTPAKVIGSLTMLFNKKGFLTADIEYVDYSSMQYRYDDADVLAENSMNKTIQNTYKSAVNVRVGAEAKLQDVSLRAGFAYYGRPYQSNAVNADRLQLSFGTGYRTNTWFLDGAFVHSMQKTAEKPYVLNNLNDVSNAIVKNNTSQLLVTLGWKF
jgi:hypothetical protein